MDKIVFTVISLLFVVGITVAITVAITNRAHERHYTRHVVSHRLVEPVHQYAVRKHSDSPVMVNGSSCTDWWLYYYILSSNNNTYYYSSTTPITNFSAVRFSSASGSSAASLPREVQEDIKDAQEQDVQPTEANEPVVQEVEMEVVGDTENPETFHDGTDANGNTVETESSPSTESAPSTDSGSTSGGDAGASSGGDTGGGGDGGGRGGE